MAKLKDDAQYLYNVPRLNIIFALTSVALMISVFVMVADDYIREWRDYQREFRQIEIEKTEAELAMNIAAIDTTELKELEERISIAKDQVAEKEDEIKPTKLALKLLEEERYRIDQKNRFAKSEYDAVKYKYEIRMEKNLEKEAAEYRELMNELNSDMDTYSSQLEINALEISNAKSIIDSISAESKSAEDELAELM